MAGRTLACAWMIGALMSTGCARRTAPVAPGPATEPRASWIIVSGPQDGRESEVCRSDRQQPCVLEAGSASRPMVVAVSVYLYPAGAPTKYSGAFQSSFIQSAGGRGYEAKVDYTIEPGRLPTAVTAAGLVTSSPGNHEFRIALLGEVPGRMDPHQFEEMVPVRVVGAATSPTTPQVQGTAEQGRLTPALQGTDSRWNPQNGLLPLNRDVYLEIARIVGQMVVIHAHEQPPARRRAQ